MADFLFQSWRTELRSDRTAPARKHSQRWLLLEHMKKKLVCKQRDGGCAGSGWNLGKCEASIEAPMRDVES